MNLGALSLEDAPGFWTPVRFFLTVPVFGVIAAIIILLDGGAMFQSRWLPESLAVTHVLALGYIAMAMLGALFQMLPVVMGASFPQTERAAVVVHLLVSSGALCLVFAFLFPAPALFAAAIALLVPALLLFGIGALVAIFKAGKAKTTAAAARLAAVSLVVTVAIGSYLASGHAFETVSLDRSLTNYHAAWGFIGWVLILAIGVSEQVIPMFLATPQYPRLFNKWLAYLLMFFLCAASLLSLQGLEEVVVVLVSLLILLYAVLTLGLLANRRRKRFDITGWFWWVGMLCLILGTGINMYDYSGGIIAGADISILSGLFLLAGFAVSIINGMLYKIVPFLVWLNLRMPAIMGKLEPGTKFYTPNIHEVIDVRPMKLQFMLHVTGLLLLVTSVFFQGFLIYVAAMAMLGSNLYLLRNLVHAVSLYRKYSGKVIAIR